MENNLTTNIENEQKPIFYIFSGIEHTLVSKNYFQDYYKGCRYIHGDIRPDPDCMKSLNYLIENLETKFDTRLVITSKKRFNPESCDNYLRIYGLKYDKPIFFTKYVAGPRGEKIVDFLEQEGASPLTFHTAPLYVRFLKNFKDNPDFGNYVVIEGALKNLSRYIPQSQIHKVRYKTGLTFEDANTILQSHGITPTITAETQKQ